MVCGITTGGWSLYPKVLAGRWPGVPHRLCEFHLLKEITKAVGHAPAEFRKGRAAGIPEPPRGWPGEQQRGRARAAAGQAQRGAALFGHRHLLARQQLSAAPQGVLRERTRGRPQLRTPREVLGGVYQPLERRRRAETALKELGRLRRGVGRFKELARGRNELKGPAPEEARVFLGGRLLGAARKAAGRANRRVREAPKGIYGAGTTGHVEGRPALARQREQRAPKRRQTVETRHRARSKAGALH